MTQEEGVRKEIEEEQIALQAVLDDTSISEDERAQKKKYHMGRLFFFAFALQAAKNRDDEEKLIALGKKAMEMGWGAEQ